MENNFKFQHYIANMEIPSKLKCFTEDESSVGIFAATTFKNNENYIIGYLNMLIHSLLTATSNFEEIIKVESSRNKKNWSFKKAIQDVCDDNMTIQELLEMK